MIADGITIRSESGRQFRNDSPLKSGGQGVTFLATDLNTGEKGVLKFFHQAHIDSNLVQRLHFLPDQDLSKLCPSLCAPTDVIVSEGMVGHFSPLAEGVSLEHYQVNPAVNFEKHIQLAANLAHAITQLHERDIAHGDLHANNIFIAAEAMKLSVIDFDNFYAPGQPAPPMLGHNLYMARELRAALSEGKPAIPNRFTDSFSLAILLHEIILLRHIVPATVETENDFHNAMYAGRWSQDPTMSGKTKGELGGFPAAVLNANLARLFRRAFSLEPAQRPSPDEWGQELLKAGNSIFCCPNCSGPCVVDASKTSCPICKERYPTLNLHLPKMSDISIDRGATMIGRDTFGGAEKVSARHAIFRRIGPNTWMESLGRNGTYRLVGSDWKKLPDKKPVLVQKGDRLKFADQEVTLT